MLDCIIDAIDYYGLIGAKFAGKIIGPLLGPIEDDKRLVEIAFLDQVLHSSFSPVFLEEFVCVLCTCPGQVSMIHTGIHFGRLYLPSPCCQGQSKRVVEP